MNNERYEKEDKIAQEELINRPKMNSKEKLANALIEYCRSEVIQKIPPEDTRVVRLNNMITLAKQGYYSDYDSPIATACIQLVKDLEYIGATELATRAKEGEFEATDEESDEWYKREGIAITLKEFRGNEKLVDALFGKIEEEKEAKEGIKGWDI